MWLTFNSLEQRNGICYLDQYNLFFWAMFLLAQRQVNSELLMNVSIREGVSSKQKNIT